MSPALTVYEQAARVAAFFRSLHRPKKPVTRGPVAKSGNAASADAPSITTPSVVFSLIDMKLSA